MDLINLYEPIIKSVIKKYLNFANKVSLEYDDLFQEASMAVLQAQRTYKDNKNMAPKKVENVMTFKNENLPDEMYNNWKKANTVTANSGWEKINFDEPIFTLEDVNGSGETSTH